ncbi:response regulator [uncultured Pseudoteredinibacter sp.]|uniref:response regulator n=1 Tax=uncultured Pseudoteredinibacter sp. TaxID=1641701 RepID=UPI002619842A|nr:response regulator [uncultured Pseudoteredinibacter sp.]
MNPSNKANSKAITLLIVEDELASMELLYSYFNQAPYEVYKAHNCSQARELLAQKTIDIVLLDITLPDGDGLALTREIRGRSNMGIILVTQRSDDIDRIVGLELGADDYVTKPYNIRELMVRVKNLASRLHQETLNNSQDLAEQISFDCWSFLPGRRLLMHVNGEEVNLTEGEYKLLAALLANPGMVLSRDQLMNKMQRRDWYPTDRTIDVMVARLRKKLQDDKGSPKYISTVHGAGYLFIAEINSNES